MTFEEFQKRIEGSECFDSFSNACQGIEVEQKEVLELYYNSRNLKNKKNMNPDKEIFKALLCILQGVFLRQ